MAHNGAAVPATLAVVGHDRVGSDRFDGSGDAPAAAWRGRQGCLTVVDVNWAIDTVSGPRRAGIVS